MASTILYVTLTVASVCGIIINFPDVAGSPVEKFTRPGECPHGRCFIDRCSRICSCEAAGNTMCTKDVVEDEAECHAKGGDKCPFGQVYQHPHWQGRFECRCNNDESQTYECFDLTKQTGASAYDLLLATKKSNLPVQSVFS